MWYDETADYLRLHMFCYKDKMKTNTELSQKCYKVCDDNTDSVSDDKTNNVSDDKTDNVGDGDTDNVSDDTGIDETDNISDNETGNVNGGDTRNVSGDCNDTVSEDDTDTPDDSRLFYYLIREIKTWLNINHITVYNNTYCIYKK